MSLNSYILKKTSNSSTIIITSNDDETESIFEFIDNDLDKIDSPSQPENQNPELETQKSQFRIQNLDNDCNLDSQDKD